MAAPTPTAEGTLARTPFGHVLLYAQQQELSGTLVVWADEPVGPDGTKKREDRIRMERGVPVAGRLAEPAGSLDRGLLPLFERTRAAYAFYEGQDLLGEEDVVEGRVEPWTLLAAAARTTMRDEGPDAVLARVGEHVLRLRADARLERFAFLPKEQAFVELLRAHPSGLASLAATAGLPERTVRRLVYLLVVTKCVDAVEPGTPASGVARRTHPGAPATSAAASPAPTPPSSPVPSLPAPPPPPSLPAPPASAAPSRPRTGPEPVPPPPPALSDGERALWDEVAERLGAMDEQTYFQMLGVGQDASGDAARDAYFALAKRLHPDRLPPSLAALLPHAQRLFRHLTEANDTLGDEDTRLKYISNVREGGGTPAADRKMSNILEATIEFQKAEVLARRRDFAGARTHIEAALELNPDEADYHALLARVLFDQHLGADAPLPAMLAAADRALALHPKHDRAHYARGLVLRRMGNESGAASEFEKAADINPKNTDAVREVRLIKMRTKGHAPEKKGAEEPKKKGDLGAMFGSLFKKK